MTTERALLVLVGVVGVAVIAHDLWVKRHPTWTELPAGSWEALAFPDPANLPAGTASN